MAVPRRVRRGAAHLVEVVTGAKDDLLPELAAVLELAGDDVVNKVAHRGSIGRRQCIAGPVVSGAVQAVTSRVAARCATPADSSLSSPAIVRPASLKRRGNLPSFSSRAR